MSMLEMLEMIFILGLSVAAITVLWQKDGPTLKLFKPGLFEWIKAHPATMTHIVLFALFVVAAHPLVESGWYYILLVLGFSFLIVLVEILRRVGFVGSVQTALRCSRCFPAWLIFAACAALAYFGVYPVVQCLIIALPTLAVSYAVMGLSGVQ